RPPHRLRRPDALRGVRRLLRVHHLRGLLRRAALAPAAGLDRLRRLPPVLPRPAVAAAVGHAARAAGPRRAAAGWRGAYGHDHGARSEPAAPPGRHLGPTRTGYGERAARPSPAARAARAGAAAGSSRTRAAAGTAGARSPAGTARTAGARSPPGAR